MNHSTQLVRLIEIAIMTGAAVILDIVSGMFLRMPQGGSVSIMMIPIFDFIPLGSEGRAYDRLLTGIVQIAIGNLFCSTRCSYFLITSRHLQSSVSAACLLPVYGNRH